ncbi:MAG: hypothetical protein ACTHLW_13650 [Verrucomicrobiota bacterium]
MSTPPTTFSVQLSTGSLISEKQNVPKVPSDRRFTLDGSRDLEQRLQVLCDEILIRVRSLIPNGRLEALVLGGGYGRGQGGVLKTARGDQPYNDLEFYVFTRGNRVWNERRLRPPLNALGEALSPEAGLHVEFKVDSLARLARSPTTMFSYDLVSGHRVLHGGDAILAGCEHHLDASAIPLAEATRLLFNRCTGLLLAKELLRQSAPNVEQSDFIGRNLAKAQLALGDVVLVAAGQYHWSCVERHERLKQLLARGVPQPYGLAEIATHHAAGADFKLHPHCISKSRQTFESEQHQISEQARQLWLWLESRRLNTPFASVRDYAFSTVSKCSESPAWRNLLLNVGEFGARVIADRMAWRYPRERLLQSLPLLLWNEPLNDLRVKRHLQNQLRTRASDWHSFVAAYKSFWPSFS